ncbi:MAG: hypothetical protein NPIRA04_04460 [Nitrospirales bacterium]|nr:MAG: hypothetical protein NPIRA04_04460 [Nitrospirales bacterium]
MGRTFRPMMVGVGLLCLALLGPASHGEAAQILIHMKTSLAEDDAQICAVPNVVWAMTKAGHHVTILVDSSAVTSVTKGFGWFNGLVRSDSTALDRAGLPERERQSLAEQMDVPLEKVPHNYGDYFTFLKSLGVEMYGNQTMMLLYNIDLSKVDSAVIPIPLHQMVDLFTSADQIVVY